MSSAKSQFSFERTADTCNPWKAATTWIWLKLHGSIIICLVVQQYSSVLMKMSFLYQQRWQRCWFWVSKGGKCHHLTLSSHTQHYAQWQYPRSVPVWVEHCFKAKHITALSPMPLDGKWQGRKNGRAMWTPAFKYANNTVTASAIYLLVITQIGLDTTEIQCCSSSNDKQANPALFLQGRRIHITSFMGLRWGSFVFYVRTWKPYATYSKLLS